MATKESWAEPALQLMRDLNQGAMRTAWQALSPNINAYRGREWPAWCVFPSWAATNLTFQAMGISLQDFQAGSEGEGLSPEVLRVHQYAEVLAAVAGWRLTKGVYLFDPDLFEALWSTPVTGQIPTELLFRLPEWCVFIPMNRRETPFGEATGVFARLDHHPEPEKVALVLTLTLNDESGLVGHRTLTLDLTSGDLSQAVAGVPKWVDGAGQNISEERKEATLAAYLEVASSVVSLVLWLCSEAPEIEGDGTPGNPKPVRTKRGLRTFPAERPKTWEVGVRIGAALRAARDTSGESGSEEEGSGRTVRPHVRRAHWHTYLTGPRNGDQTPVLRWLNPILVGSSDPGELPAVIRSVE